ncbi:MAG: glycosyltransferase [Bacteroidetes bacterium]|nr:glycosyltransferase [Bacteroidota bacterium]
MQNQKRILICPLDWGLGHASRCIPIIRSLIKNNAEVIIAADGRPLELLRLEFPDLKFIVFKGYAISYPDAGSMKLKMLFSIPKILKGIREEHEQVEKIIDEYKIDVVISDNRYGCWSKKVKSIFITHQLMIKSGVAEGIFHRKVLSYIKNYDECWVPDNEAIGELSGDLSHKYPLSENTYFIGTLSRFSDLSDSSENKSALPANENLDVLAIVSGPEPQRTKLKTILKAQLEKSGLKAVLICGEPESTWEEKVNDKLTLYSHCNSADTFNLITKSNIIIARSGYSTIMDMAALGKKAIFIPTPGQTEQEYLAEDLKNKKIAFYQKQSEFDLKIALGESENYTGFKKIGKNKLLERRIENLI